MKQWPKIVMGLVVLTIIGVWLHSRPTPALRDLQDTRRSLRQEGFKLDLREFNLSVPPELIRRTALLGRTTFAELTNRARPDPFMGDMRDFPVLVTPYSYNAAIPAWKLRRLKSYGGAPLWPELRQTLSERQEGLEAARRAAISGPIRFEPIGSQRPNPLLPYLGDMKNLATTLGVLTVIALHDGDAGAAWTNLLAATCLATAYEPEPIEISHLSRFGYVTIAYDSTWNALQASGWTETQLANLQRRWESLDLWTNLPETAAYARANAAAICQLDRQQPLGLRLPLGELVRYPKGAWSALAANWNQVVYRAQGTYEDESALLLYYRDREVELRQALLAPTWAEIRHLPGATNFVPFTLKPSRVAALMNTRHIALSFQSRGVGLLGRAAEAETRRRLVIVALGLERHRVRHGSYPANLGDLMPEILDAAPIDFMDGQPLRYQLTQDGHFLLYSVGLDCVDNGGRIRQPGIPFNESLRDFGFQPGIDLAWARLASAAEIERFEAEAQRVAEVRMKSAEDAQAQAWWDITTRRQSNVERALASPAVITNEPVYGGRRLSEILSNRSGTNKPSLLELLTLTQVVTEAEPETVAFELPIRYETLTNLGELFLCIDRYGSDYEEGWAVGHCECVPVTNGDCRLVWSTIYEPPGKHALLAGLALKELDQHEEGIFGPVTPFVVTNLGQFTPQSAVFNPNAGAKFYARLAEPNGAYRIELKSPVGELLKTIRGSTTNGFVEVHWDLTDERGRHCTNDSYDSVFHITLTESGRSQTLKGP
jgi:hypothetical protein